MRVTIAAVGKMKSSSHQALMQGYLKRIPWKVDIKQVDAKKGLCGEALKAKEGGLLLQALPKGSKKIVLDERGEVLSSQEFSALLQAYERDGFSQVSFLIGGADGHGQVVRQQADKVMSFGKMVWPHMLVRVMLAEQCYRAYTISTGHPYHRD